MTLPKWCIVQKILSLVFMVNPSTAHAAAKSYYAAVKSTATGGLAVNNKVESSNAGKSKELTVIPIGAVCVYRISGRSQW